MKASLKKAGETRDKAVRALFSVFESILGQAASGRWDRIVAKICVRGSTTNETSSDGRSVSRFRFCQRELMLEVFSQDTAEKQRKYLLFHLKMNWQITLRVWVTRVKHLSRICAYLPCLADSAEAPEGLERASRPLSLQELCGLIMRAIPQEWADQYRLMADSSLVPVEVDKLMSCLQKLRHWKKTAGDAWRTAASASPRSRVTAKAVAARNQKR